MIGFAAGGDSDGQGQPAAAAQRQRRSASDTASSSTASPGRAVGVRVRRRRSWSRPGCDHRRRCGIRCRRAGRRCRAWPTAGCSARSCWSRDRAAGVGVRRVRHRRRLALQHHPRTRGVRPSPWAATGLADLRRQLARRLCPRDGSSAPRRASVDENRRPTPDDSRGPASVRPGITSIERRRTIDHLNRSWHRLDPWPDSVRGLTRLEGTVRHHDAVERQRLAADQHGQACGPAVGLRDLRRTVPPLQAGPRRPTSGAPTCSTCAPEQLMLVAAHPGDLRAARAAGLMTGVRRAAAGVRPRSATAQGGRRRIRFHSNGFSRPRRPAGRLNSRRSVEG